MGLSRDLIVVFIEEGFLITMIIIIMMIRFCFFFCLIGLIKGLVLESIIIYFLFS